LDKQLYIIDATDLLVGRLATHAAKQALLGKDVKIINAEKAVISGSKAFLVAEWRRRFLMGVPKKGPYIHRYPDRIVRRIIRGMLPYKTPRGKAAFARAMCYIGVPAELKDAKTVSFKEVHVNTLPELRCMTIGNLCKEIGGKWHE
jgi:large subunit ribosomal protein L13